MPSYTAADRARTVASIFDRLACGMTLDQIATLPDSPSRPTLRKWAREDPHLADLMVEGRRVRRQRERHVFDPTVAADLLLRMRRGQPLSQLLRQPGMPHRRMLNAWKRQSPAFAADLEAAKAFADPERRRYGRRRARMRYDTAIAHRLLRAVREGATLPDLGRDPTLPSPIGLKRWRKADPEFDAALRLAMKVGHPARGRARARAQCSPQMTDEIGRRLADGASLYGLSRQPDMPSATTLYKWVREHPAFAERVARACEFRDWMLADQATGIVERVGSAQRSTARRAVGAINKKLGQRSPHPGARRGER